MKRILFLLFTICQFTIIAQTIISGEVTDKKGEPIMGANVYLDGTYDGVSTDENGKFSFSTKTTGTQKLIVSFISFETYSKSADISTFKNLDF